MWEPKFRTPGMARSSRLASTVIRSISATDAPGLVMKCIRKSVSWNSGRNSDPNRVAAAPDKANVARMAPRAAHGRCSNNGSTSAYARRSTPASGASWLRPPRPASSMYDRAGVTVRATPSDARMASMYERASGRKNAPAMPSRKKIGRNTIITIIVAYTTALRTSRLASTTTRNGDRGCSSVRFSRSRRTMFSTSMMASSTTSPRAITSPAITIVLRVMPRAVSTTTADTRDRGMAVRLMTAVRQSNRKATRMTATSPQPRSKAWPRLATARSTNVAGRKMVGSMSTAVRPGANSRNASSTRRDTSSVFPSGCFSTISSSPGVPSAATPPAVGRATMMASPMAGGEPIRTVATSPRRIGALP